MYKLTKTLERCGFFFVCPVVTAHLVNTLNAAGAGS